MKRPFAVLCVVFAALSVIRYAAGGSGRDRPLVEAVGLLRGEADGGGKITVTGTVAKCSAVSSGVRLSVDHLTIQRKDNSEQSLLPDLNVTITTEHREILPGDELVVSGEPDFWEPASNPGQFDAQSYYFSQNTLCTLFDAKILGVTQGGMSLARFLCIVRQRLGEVYETILGEHQAEVMEAVCLGERSLLPQEWKQLYQEGGISHILAISGLHISLVGMCLYRLFRRLCAPFGVCCAVSGTAVALYVLMSGASVSALRALIMFAFWLGAQLWGRKNDMPTAIAAAAALLLLIDVRNLTQSSFLLSFGAVLSIALLVPCLEGVFGAANGLPALFLPGFGIWLGTLPVTLYFFYQAVPWSILINLAVLPLMSLLMAYGLVAGMIGLVSIPLGVFLAAPSHYLVGAFEFLCRLKEGLPLPLWVAGRPALWRSALYYGILLATGIASRLLMRKKRDPVNRQRKTDIRKIVLCVLWTFCSVLCVGLMLPRAQKTLAVICLDVGQGDAAVLRLPGGTSCLIDGGSSSESKLWQYRIGQAVKYYGIHTLDYIFLSHADEDHISGIEEYLQEYEFGFAGENIHGITLKNLVLPPTAKPDDFEKLRELAREKGIQLLCMDAGDAIGSDAAEGGLSGTIGNSVTENGKDNAQWSIRCLAPAEDSLTGDRNEDSMVLMLQYGEFRMLFTGDLEGTAERQLASSGEKLSADVLKVGHHGSKNASSEEFLAQVSPQIAVISCAENNSYGHPAPETVERLEKAGSQIFQTPKCGAVMIESDGERYSVESYLRF